MTSALDRTRALGANRYIDTRGACTDPAPFTQAVVDGLAPGGGLYVPEELPSLGLDDILALAHSPYAERAAYLYKLFNIDLGDAAIDELMAQCYGSSFDTPAIAPVVPLGDGISMLELWHGPTSAFKDMALQCLPRFFSASADALRSRGQLDHSFCILVATSGDTGKAALEGFKDVPGVEIAVLYPEGGVSDIQRKQMVTTTGANVQVWGVRGNFDDCQTGVKRVFGDEAFAAKLQRDFKVALSSANSINWGRLMPQIVYYVSSYAEMVAQGAVTAGEAIDVCVPTGNFGNILAAWYARQMGTPIGRLMCASNENCVLTDFITTGAYDIADREFVLTPSPSMDILVSSNLERQLFELTGRDAAAIRGWMRDLNDKGRFSVDEGTLGKLQAAFSAASVSNAECLATIKEAFDRYGYLMDPHTAVAYAAAQQLRGDAPVLVASTAHWAKFGTDVYRALHGLAPGAPLPSEAEGLTGCQLNELIASQTSQSFIPANLALLDAMEVRFSDAIDAAPSAIEQAVAGLLAR